MLDIFKDVNNLLIYFVPGFLFVFAYNYFSFRTLKEINVKDVIASIIISFILNIIAKNIISINNITIDKTNEDIMKICVIGASFILSIIWFFITRILRRITIFQRVIASDDTVDYVITKCKSEKKGVTFRGKIGEIFYQGPIHYLEDTSSDKMVLINYKIYTLEDDEVKLIIDNSYKEIDNRYLLIDINKFDHVELISD